jgi:hypothetical protein
MTKQVKTVNCTYRTILRTKYFKFGVEDIASGRGWHPDYEKWDTNAQWGYERGRQFALFTKGKVSVKNGRAVNIDAIRQYMLGAQEKCIL